MPEPAFPATAQLALVLTPTSPARGAEAGMMPAALTSAACANCLAPMETTFCGQCGAPGLDHRPLTVRRFTQDLWTELTSVDSATVRTLRTLILEPGRLTREYLDGRTRWYLSPLRLFLITVTTMVFVNSVSGYQARVEARLRSGTGTRDAKPVAAGPARQPLHPAPRAAVPHAPPSEKTLRRRAILRGVDMQKVHDQFVDTVLATLTNPWLQLINPIAVALALAIVLKRKRRNFAEHFVFALHFMAFSSLLSAAMIPARLADESKGFFGPMLLLFWVVAARYFFLAARRVYADSTRRTVVDTMLFAITAQSAMFVLPFVAISTMVLWTIARFGIRLLLA